MLDKFKTLWGCNKFPQSSLVISENTEDALSQISDFVSHILSFNTEVSLENNPDFRIIRLLEEDKEIKIDQIRSAVDFFSKTPAISKNKILVIYQADLMNINAANAILKMLEEPTKNSYIFLVTHYENSIIPTLKSRCAIFNSKSDIENISKDYSSFSKKSTDELFKMAANIALKKNYNIWVDYTISALNLMSNRIKYASGINVDLEIEYQPKYPIHYLIHQYNKVKKIIDDNATYELDKRQAAIMIYDIVN